jgi:rhamnogalacturonan endolyase
MKRKLFVSIFLACTVAGTIDAQIIVNENIDRGVIALTIDGTHAYIGWRLLRSDPVGISFNIYRKEVGTTKFHKVNQEAISTTTNFVDQTVKLGMAYRYRIKTVINGKEHDSPGEATVFMLGNNQPYYSIKLNDNSPGIKGVGIGDLDGDGAYDFVIQSPGSAIDPLYSNWKRSREPFKLDAYTSNGQYLWHYDMGWSIETGTWYSPLVVYDVDGDHLAEVYTKAGEGDPRELDGHVLEGPEYLVKIDGLTGKIVQKTGWLSKEGFENKYHNLNRNLLTVAYLNGQTPSLVMSRGTYSIHKTMALDKSMKKEWYWESTGENEKIRGQGMHGIIQGDVDFDGKDELIMGTYALDHNGTTLWALPPSFGHNDIAYLTDIDPVHPGMEVFYGMETWQLNGNGVCLVDAATGKIIWGFEGKIIHVHKQGMVADIDSRYPGMECYALETKGKQQAFLYSSNGDRISDKSFDTFSPRPLWWDEDDQKEIYVNDQLFKYEGDTLLETQGSFVMVADIIGDWREEMITYLPGELRIYSTNIPASTKKVSLIQNHQYRLGVANASMGYYYPPQLGLEKEQ